MVSVKVRGLPYSAQYEDVSEFFKDFHYIERSVVMGLGYDGRKNGFGAILFEDEKEAKDAMAKNQGQYVGARYVELSLISYGDYTRFNGPPSKGGNQGSYVKLSKFVTADNKDRALVMRGLPYKVEPEDIIGFFEGFGKITPGDIFIEESNGRRTGSALVFFENHEVSQDAKAAQNKKNIGQESRYVELHDSNDLFMKKVCQLYDDEEPTYTKETAQPQKTDE
jgi:RNA recognition motif-containing protein